MSISSIAVKKTALTSLKGKYLESLVTVTIYIFACLICLFCAEIISPVIGGFGTVIFLAFLLALILLPITLGLAFWGVRLIFANDANPLTLFNYFTDRARYTRAIKLSLPLTVKTVYTGVILFIPCFFCDLIANGKIFTLVGAEIPLWTSGFSGVSAILKFLASLFLIIIMLKYYLAPFLLAADKDMDPMEALHISKVIALRSKKDFIWLILSFTHYILLCVLMIPLIFIMPYFTASYAVHCRFAVAAYNKVADSMNSPDIPSFNPDISF